MQLNQKFITSNNQGANDTCTPKYIVIHDTGNTSVGATANNHYLWLNNNNDLGRSAHIFIDDHEAIQVIPFNRMSYHTGALYLDVVECPDCKNHNSIGIEFCVDDGSNLELTLNNLVEIVAELQRDFNIKHENVITHYMSAGKRCPMTFIKNPSLYLKFKASLLERNHHMKNFKEAVSLIHKEGIINSPEYWQRQTDINVQNLIINISNYIKRE